jgi:YggT family protein
MINPIVWLIHTIIWLYIYTLVAVAVLSWLIAFDVLNTRNQFVRQIADVLHRLTEPALRLIRNFMPNLGGIDVSPVILVIGLMFIDQIVYWIYFRTFA